MLLSSLRLGPGARSPLSCERSVRSGQEKSELVLIKKGEAHRLIGIMSTKVTDLLMHSRFCFVNTCKPRVN